MSLLDLPEGELAAVVSTACRTARYDEYLALTESSIEQYEDLADACTRLAAGTPEERRAAHRMEIRRDVARERAALYAGVAAAYRPVVDVDRLVERVVDRLAELVRLVPTQAPRTVPVTAPKSPSTPPLRPPSYDRNPTLLDVRRADEGYRKYATTLDRTYPGWWRDDLDRMAPGLAMEARTRRMAEPVVSSEDGAR